MKHTWSRRQQCCVEQVIEVWVSILQAVPNARFLLKNKPFACPAAREHVLQLFVKKGIDANRIDLLPLAPANAGESYPSAFTASGLLLLSLGFTCVV